MTEWKRCHQCKRTQSCGVGCFFWMETPGTPEPPTCKRGHYLRLIGPQLYARCDICSPVAVTSGKLGT